ncbi:MAG: CBS domain-containing protein [Microscillaceae bacterium]|nr:CBS domain-containing protein [Microscillaceae bacterium]MDW8461980.1 CBS domain-containing protein [Cytophagales bacterium]
MIAEELINQTIPPLKKTDKVETAIHWMEELRVNQLPVVDKGVYEGLVSEEAIFHHNQLNALVADLAITDKDAFVYANQHFYDVLRVANNHKIQVVPVLDNNNNRFLGVVTVNDTISAISKSTSMQEQGGILVLAIHQRDYSLSEISRLVEENDAKILSTFIAVDEQNPQILRVTVKINKTDLTRIIATLERFGYNIVAKFQPTETQSIDKERLDLLFRYLNI